VLYFIGLFFELDKKLVQPPEMAIPRPKQLFLCRGEVGVSPVYGEVEFRGITNKPFSPFTHFFTTPRSDGPIVYRPAFIWDHQVRIDTNNAAISFATLASAIRVVETKEIWGRFFKRNTIQC